MSATEKVLGYLLAAGIGIGYGYCLVIWLAGV